MKNILILLLIVLSFSLSGCASKEVDKFSQSPVLQQPTETRVRTITESEPETQTQTEPKKDISTRYEYKIGDVFLNYKVFDEPQSEWSFNGFIGEDTFVISRIKNPNYTTIITQEYFCPLETGFTIKLPDTKVTVKLVGFSTERKTIIIEQIVQ